MFGKKLKWNKCLCQILDHNILKHLLSFVVKITFSNYKSVHPALEDDAYNSSEDEGLEAGYDEEVDKPITFKVT